MFTNSCFIDPKAIILRGVLNWRKISPPPKTNQHDNQAACYRHQLAQSTDPKLKNNQSDPMASQSTRSTEDLIRKSLHAGHVYQLTHAKKEDGPSLRNWFENFLSLFEVEERTFIQKVQYLWRKDDILKVQSRLMFPANRKQLAELFNQGRLAKDMFDPALTDAEVAVVVQANGAALDYAVKAEGTNPVCETCRKDCVGTCKGHRRVFDRVVKHITNGLYETAPAAFEEAAIVRKALAKFQNSARRFILPELADAFNNGKYINWNSLTNSIRRAFNVKEEKQTMSNLFSRIHQAATGKVNMENKIDCLANIAMEIAITDEADYFRPIDFDGDLSQTMSHPEHYGPLVNTLLTYIVMRESVPTTKWEQVQTDFERKIQSGWSYRRWHENRPQLYEIIDRMKTDGRIASVEGDNVETGRNETECSVDVNINPDDGNLCPVYQRKQPRRSNGNDQRGRNQPQPPTSQEDRRRANQQAPRKRHCLCLNCSHHHPNRMTVYHPEGSGFGGKGKYCLFDENGKERSDAKGRTIHTIGEEFEFIDADGIFPIMANLEMFDIVDDTAMGSGWNVDMLPRENE